MKKFILFFAVSVLCFAAGPKLGRKKIAEGVSILLPKEFLPMSDDEIALRYPSSKKPLVMYTSEDRNIDFGYNVSKSQWGNDFNMLKDFYKATILSMYNSAKISREEIKIINKQKFIVMEFTSQVERVRNYTYIQYTVIKNNIYIFNFTCPEQMKEKWAPTADMIMKSVKVNQAQFKEIKTDSPEDKLAKNKSKYLKSKTKPEKTPQKPKQQEQNPANVR